MSLAVFIKPASSSCNLNCRYCFYHDELKYREIKNYGIMNYETMNNLIRKVFEREKRLVFFAFQGGEPLLAGLKYFEGFVETVKKYNVNNAEINYALQTNGTLIDDDYAEFFKANNFLLGISLDGYQEIHNYLRGDTYLLILKNIEILKKHKVEFNILCVVTKYIAKHASKVYANYKKLGFKYLQFIACLDEFNNVKKDFSLDDKLYGEFLVNLYKLWKRDYDNGDYVSIRLFDNLYQRMMGRKIEMCGLNGFCSMQNVIEADGTVYPCDFYCTDEYKLGNINENSFEEIYKSENLIKFLKKGIEINKDCKVCKYFQLCRGGCKREYENGKNKFCLSYKMLIKEMTSRK